MSFSPVGPDVEEAVLNDLLQPRLEHQNMPKTRDSKADRFKAEQLLVEHFRCTGDVANFAISGDLSHNCGFFRLGSDAICYGQCSSGFPAKFVAESLHDARKYVVINGSSVHLPFDPAQVIDNLRCERYRATWKGLKALPSNSVFRRIYYGLRPAMPILARQRIQKLYFRGWDRVPFPRWPVEQTVESIFEQLMLFSMKSRAVKRVPFIWFWPQGARSCTMMTHDVETASGRDFCPQLMDLDDSFGIKSSFQIVPERRYANPRSFLESIRRRGFELNVQDLNHDGLLFSDRDEFLRRAKQINRYARQFDALGFRSGVLYRNADWYDALDFSYDMSIPNVAHLDAQQGGCCTTLPYFIGNILELPVTTTQDYSVFHVLNDYSIQLWKEQIALIRRKHGLISFVIHPDYIINEVERKVYTELLQYLSDLRSQGETWIALPNDVATWWRLRSELKVVKVGNSWRIEGNGRERARLAYAVIDNETLTYEFDHSF